MIQCPDCSVRLTSGTVRCPVCKRILSKTTVARRVGVALLVAATLILVGVIALSSHRIETRLLWGTTTPADAYKAAQLYLRDVPDLRGASNFSNLRDSVVERWGPTRWRVSGSVDTEAAPGTPVHTFYACVMHYDGQSKWVVEDLTFQRLK